MAPPTPTTTPIITFFCDGLTPELLEFPLLELSPGAAVDFVVGLVTGIKALVVRTEAKVLLPVTVMTVVTNSCVALETGRAGGVVGDGVDSLGGGVLLDEEPS